jgi:hypothetical protein
MLKQATSLTNFSLGRPRLESDVGKNNAEIYGKRNGAQERAFSKSQAYQDFWLGRYSCLGIYI